MRLQVYGTRFIGPYTVRILLRVKRQRVLTIKPVFTGPFGNLVCVDGDGNSTDAEFRGCTLQSSVNIADKAEELYNVVVYGTDFNPSGDFIFRMGSFQE